MNDNWNETRFGLLQLYKIKGNYKAYAPVSSVPEPKDLPDSTVAVAWICRHLWLNPLGWRLHRHIDVDKEYQLTIKHEDFDDPNFYNGIEWASLGKPIVSGSKRKVLAAFRAYARMI